MPPASSQGPTGKATSFTLGKYFFRILVAASIGLATPGASDFHALVSHPILRGRECNSMDGENVKAPLSMGTVPRSFGSWPAMAAKIRAQSSALRAIGPILSIEGASAIAPERATPPDGRPRTPPP